MNGDTEQILARLARTLASSVPGGAGQQTDIPGAVLWVGQIVAVNSSVATTYTVTLDGVNPRVGVPSLGTVAVGDTVWVLEQPPMLLILGVIPLQPGGPGGPGGPFRVGSSQLGSDSSLNQS